MRSGANESAWGLRGGAILGIVGMLARGDLCWGLGRRSKECQARGQQLVADRVVGGVLVGVAGRVLVGQRQAEGPAVPAEAQAW